MSKHKGTKQTEDEQPGAPTRGAKHTPSSSASSSSSSSSSLSVAFARSNIQGQALQHRTSNVTLYLSASFFFLSFLLFFDPRTHLSFLLFFAGLFLFGRHARALVDERGLIAWLPDDWRPLMTEYSLLELSQMSWTNTALLDSLSLLTLQLDRQQIAHILERLPDAWRRGWTTRGIVNNMPEQVQEALLPRDERLLVVGPAVDYSVISSPVSLEMIDAALQQAPAVPYERMPDNLGALLSSRLMDSAIAAGQAIMEMPARRLIGSAASAFQQLRLSEETMRYGQITATITGIHILAQPVGRLWAGRIARAGVDVGLAYSAIHAGAYFVSVFQRHWAASERVNSAVRRALVLSPSSQPGLSQPRSPSSFSSSLSRCLHQLLILFRRDPRAWRHLAMVALWAIYIYRGRAGLQRVLTSIAQRRK